ncbi:peptidase inhibitor family I36 protein [Streptomyces sp. NPDC057555]|uniref:peptidase inhibitor family I36 protein n=1 Tax=Streptomyces sp. NPDC057555 TaxID=3346166 RepID=UPI0036B2E1CA
MRRMRALAVASAALAVTFGLAPTVAAAPAKPVHRAAYNCTSGYFCIYSDWNGKGTRCQWSQRSKANTADDCSFIQRGRNVRSVWNRTGHRVQYYTQTNYHHRVGSTQAGARGNLQGNYQIRSFKPQ